MRVLFFLLIVLLACSCKTQDNKTIELLIINNSFLNLKDFEKIDCFEILQSNNNAITDDHIRIKQVKKVNTNNRNTYAKLILKNIEESSYWYNIEVYRVNNLDTLRISNFGGRKVSEAESVSSIKETLCKFLNK